MAKKQTQERNEAREAAAALAASVDGGAAMTDREFRLESARVLRICDARNAAWGEERARLNEIVVKEVAVLHAEARRWALENDDSVPIESLTAEE
jgi:hypothetical protein